MVAAAMLFVRPVRRRLFLASTALGLLFTFTGSLVYMPTSEGAVVGAQPVLILVILYAVPMLASAIGARRPPHEME